MHEFVKFCSPERMAVEQKHASSFMGCGTHFRAHSDPLQPRDCFYC